MELCLSPSHICSWHGVRLSTGAALVYHCVTVLLVKPGRTDECKYCENYIIFLTIIIFAVKLIELVLTIFKLSVLSLKFSKCFSTENCK
jgi:hypothetical protein